MWEALLMYGVAWRRVFLLASVFLLFGAPLFPGTNSNATSQYDSSYPQIQTVLVNVNESQSTLILVPIDNSGSPINWTDMRLAYANTNPGIKITTDPLLFIEGPIPARSDNYSISVGISVADNVSVGQYTIPFTLNVKSSIYSPSTSIYVKFNVIITVLKSQPRPFPVIILFPPFILVTAAAMIGIVLRWSRDWNIFDVKSEQSVKTV